MLVLVGTGALVAAAALVGAGRLVGGSAAAWLAAAYVLAFAEILAVALALSLVDGFSRWPLLGAAVAVAVAVAAWARPVALPSLRPALDALRDALRDPAVAIVAVVAAGTVCYSAALALFRPPNDEDALAYHLVKAAFWAQDGAVGHIAGARDARVDEWVSNAEIAQAFTMVASGTGRFAPLLQLVAALVAAVAIAGIARRIGLGRRESVLGGLLFLTAPLVALQASTALNDVVVGSLVVCAALFLLGRSRVELALAGLAVALLVGTKLTGTLSLVGLALVGLVARRHRPLHVVVTLAVSTIVGAYWYALNVAGGRDAFGGVGGERVPFDIVDAVARVIRLLLAAVELPGAAGLDRLLYVAAAAIVGAVVARGAGPARGALAAGATVLPLLVVGIDRVLLRGAQRLFSELGEPYFGTLDANRSFSTASPLFSWYGPAGVLLTVLALVVVVRGVHRKRMEPVLIALAAAPLLWIALVGVGIPYWEWNGRYAIGGFALAAATWGLVLRWPALALATAAVVALSAGLAFVHLHDRASGLRLLEPARERSVWTQPDWSIQATDNQHLRALYRFVDRSVPEDAVIAVQPEVWPEQQAEAGNLPPYPFFGRDLGRTVRYAESPAAAQAAGAGWAVLRDQDEPCEGWRRAFRFGGWVVLRRAPAASC